MNTVSALIKRNVKLFFKDKGMFFTSLITPAILLVLYGTFLGNIYRDSFISSLPEAFVLPEGLINGLVGRAYFIYSGGFLRHRCFLLKFSYGSG